MSELKARLLGRTMNEYGCDTKIYIKSEADDVITELKVKLKVQTSNAEKAWKLKDTYHTSYAEAVKELYDKNKEISELKKQVHDYAQGLYVIQARGEKESRHHKYKRCLDKAEYCKVCSTYYFNVSEIEKDEDKVAEYRNISDWYDKWAERWLELAEKFKD